MIEAIKNQSGNALWFILLAVALLAFLTGVISRNSSSVNQSGGVEQARIKATSILRFSKSVENTVQEMMINGTSENDLDFKAINASHDNTNCSDSTCEVFDVEGGGISYQSAADLLSDSSHTDDWFISTKNIAYQFGCDTTNNGCTDLILLTPNIPKSVCLQINKIQGITNPSGDAPRLLELTYGSEYTGSYDSVVNSTILGGTNATNEAPQVTGKSAGCVFEFGGGQDTYQFYQILIPR